MNEDRRIQKARLHRLDMELSLPKFQVNVRVCGTAHDLEGIKERLQLLTEGVAGSDGEYSIGEITEVRTPEGEIVDPIDEVYPTVGVPAHGYFDEPLGRSGVVSQQSDPTQDLPEVPRIVRHHLTVLRGTDIQHAPFPNVHKLEDVAAGLERSPGPATREDVIDDN